MKKPQSQPAVDECKFPSAFRWLCVGLDRFHGSTCRPLLWNGASQTRARGRDAKKMVGTRGYGMSALAVQDLFSGGIFKKSTNPGLQSLA